MNRFGLRFHHLGLAVQRPQEAFRFLSDLGYRVGPIVFDPMQLVNLALCNHSQMPAVEVIYPNDVVSPIERLLRRNSSLIYHICYTTECVSAAISAIQETGLNVAIVSEPKPAILFDGRQVSFYSISGFGLIELLHYNEEPSTT